MKSEVDFLTPVVVVDNLHFHTSNAAVFSPFGEDNHCINGFIVHSSWKRLRMIIICIQSLFTVKRQA